MKRPCLYGTSFGALESIMATLLKFNHCGRFQFCTLQTVPKLAAESRLLVEAKSFAKDGSFGWKLCCSWFSGLLQFYWANSAVQLPFSSATGSLVTGNPVRLFVLLSQNSWSTLSICLFLSFIETALCRENWNGLVYLLSILAPRPKTHSNT